MISQYFPILRCILMIIYKYVSTLIYKYTYTVSIVWNLFLLKSFLLLEVFLVNFCNWHLQLGIFEYIVIYYIIFRSEHTK